LVPEAALGAGVHASFFQKVGHMGGDLVPLVGMASLRAKVVGKAVVRVM
jgi:hypothetical protein